VKREWTTGSPKVREFLDNQDEDASSLLDNFKLNLYSSEIFVFTPNGDLKKFPEGSTVLDFAFDIHSAVELHASGQRLMGKMFLFVIN
jgi:GTP diphosphokinase / guanosine-3',5'-bis(diphosphate) 3'-diphosphatase